MADNIDMTFLFRQLEQMKAERDTLMSERFGGGGPPGGEKLEARVAQLETHVQYIRRDLDGMSTDLKEVRNDITTIKRGMAYAGGAGFVVAAAFAWVVNNRFDEVVSMLTKAAS